VEETLNTSEEFVRYSCLRESVPMWKGLSLEGEIVRYPSVSLSPTLSRNEIVEQHIRKKTHKPNALRFWVEGGVISLCGFWLSSHCVRSSWCCPLGNSQQKFSIPTTLCPIPFPLLFPIPLLTTPLPSIVDMTVDTATFLTTITLHDDSS